jgi:predicted Zn finger-like uncharacterized protein
LIVECGSCQTRFQLDPSRIPLRGIRVRCSHCKTAFFLPHPDATPADAADDVAVEAARDAAASPQATQDLASQNDHADVEDDAGAEVDVEVDVEDEDAEAEEEDWEFNDGPAEPAPQADGEADSAFEIASASESPADDTDYPDDDPIPGLGDDPDSTATSDPEEAASEIANSELGVASDWSEQASSAEGESGVGLELSSAEEGLSIDLAGDDSSSQADGEFGEAADFSASSADVRQDDSLSGSGSASEPESEAALFGNADQDLRHDAGPVEVAEPAGEETAEAPADAEPSVDRAPESAEQPDASEERTERLPASAGPGMSRVEPARAPSRVLAQLRNVVGAVGWGITLSLLGVGLVWGLLRVPLLSAAGPERVVLGDFYVEGVRGGWLETARAGLVYTVSGRLVNADRISRRPESYLQVALVGSSGSRLDVPAAVAGAPLPPGYLRELAAEDLRAASADATARLAWAPLAPGAGSDFLAYFVDLPPEAEGFVLEMASRSPDPQDARGWTDEAVANSAEVEPMDPVSP